MKGDAPRQIPLDLGFRQAYAREDLWVSRANADAVAWIDRWPDWGSPLLVVYGPAASGKTHLAHVWQKSSAAVEAQVSAMAAIAADARVRAVFLRNADEAMAETKAQEDLFHLYNALRERGGHLLLTAQQAPKDWDVRLQDLRSRLMAASAVAVGQPDDELMSVVLMKMFSDRQIFVPQDVVRYIVPRIERSFSAMRDIVARLDRRALAEKKPVTLAMTRAVIGEDVALL